MLPFNLGVGGGGVVDIGDNIPNSLMLDSTATQYLSRAQATTLMQKCTIHMQVKRGKLGQIQTLFSLGATGTGYNGDYLYFDATDHLVITYDDSINTGTSTTVAAYRDPSAWLHITAKWDTTQAVQADRFRLYVNGKDTNIGCTLALNTSIYYTGIIGSVTAKIGVVAYSGIYPADVYFGKIILVQDQALTPDNFGRTSVDTSEWVNKNYTGTYGANGFKLEFLNSAALGTDTSGNGNNWTLNGGIVAANQYTDTPTNNYCVLNPLRSYGVNTLTKGNTGCTLAASGSQYSSLAVSSGLWFWEVSASTLTGAALGIGVSRPRTIYSTAIFTDGIAYYAGDGSKFIDGVQTSYGAAWAINDVIGIKLDVTNSTIEFFKNGVSQGSFSIPSGQQWSPAFSNGTGTGGQVFRLNNGSTPFTYPSNQGTAKPLCTANLPTPSIIKPANSIAHRWEAGSGIAANIAADRALWTDWIEIFKRTDSAEDWKLRFSSDTGNMLACNTNAAKTAWVTPSAGTYLGLALKASVATGIITGTYSGNSAALQDIAHGLGTAPKFALIKDEATGSVYIWHTSMTGATYFTIMDSATPPAQSLTNTPFGGSGWTSTTFGVTNNATNNLNATGHTYRYILFADVPGFLKNTTHTGNGAADGAFEYVDGRPQVQIEKNLSATTDFYLFSDLIDPYNVTASTLSMNTTAAKAAATGVDIVSNGIKHRSTTIANAANPYMDVSIIRNSIKYSNAR